MIINGTVDFGWFAVPHPARLELAGFFISSQWSNQLVLSHVKYVNQIGSHCSILCCRLSSPST